MCCGSRPLVRDFLNLIDSFNLTQSVAGPTHEKSHNLDLVVLLGLSVEISEICSTCILGYLAVLFALTGSSPDASTGVPVCHQRAINMLSASQFSAAFRETYCTRWMTVIAVLTTSQPFLTLFALRYWILLLLGGLNS